MNGDDLARVIYFGLLLSAVAGSLFVGGRQRMGKTAQQAAIWALIFLGAIAAHGLWGDIRRSVVPGAARVGADSIEIPAAADGHFYLTAGVNGQSVLFVIDTGATGIALTRADARRAGLDPATLVYNGQSQTANGMVATADVRLERLDVGPFNDEGVPASVLNGDLDTSLLGMSYLGRFQMTMEGKRLTLRR